MKGISTVIVDGEQPGHVLTIVQLQLLLVPHDCSVNNDCLVPWTSWHISTVSSPNLLALNMTPGSK
jgi:hypothetical protein